MHPNIVAKIQRKECTTCAQPAIPGQRQCPNCTARKNTRYWQRVREGLCVRCAEGQARKGKRTCLSCAIKVNLYCQQRYLRELARGICSACHRRPHAQQRRQCLPCYLKAQRRLAREALS